MIASVVARDAITAVHAQYLARDEASLFAQQEDHRCRNFIGAGKAAHGNAGEHLLLFLAADRMRCPERFRFDRAWRHRIHCDVVGRQLERPGTGAGDETLLGGTVAGMAEGAQTEVAAYVHYPALATGLHRRHKGLRNLNRDPDIYVEGLIQLCQRYFTKWSVVQRTHIVDNAVHGVLFPYDP